MRSKIGTLAMLLMLALVTAFACSQKKDTITGVVEEIQQGKDGYTAKIKTEDGVIYFVTISHANLKDHTQYRSVKVGDTIEVKGDQWDANGETHITVRELLP